MTRPLVSYLVTVFNKAPYLHDLTLSILAQNVKPAEIIFSEDASTDNSWEILHEIQKNHSMPDLKIDILKSTVNKGPSFAINSAISAVSGKFLHFVDADDVIPIGATQKMIAMSERHGADIVYGGKKKLVANCGVDYDNVKVDIHRNALLALVKERLVGIRFLATREDDSCGADERLFVQDVSLPLRIAFQARTLVYLNAPVVCVRDVPSSLSKNRFQELADYIGAVHYFIDDFPVDRSVAARLVRRCLGRLRRSGRSSNLLLEVQCSLGYVPKGARRLLDVEFRKLLLDGLARSGFGLESSVYRKAYLFNR